VAEQDAKLLASVGQGVVVKGSPSPHKAPQGLLGSDGAITAHNSSSSSSSSAVVAAWHSLCFYASYLLLGFGLLVVVVLLAFVTLAAASKVMG
jgi:hypothetical protein